MEKKKLIIFTGAGISAESGVKTFRDEDGLWYGYKPEEVAHINGWKKDKQKVLDFYNKRRRDLESAEPNSAHKGLAELEEFFDVCIITQNVDDLHEKGGSTNILHLHGELNKMCSSRNKAKILPYTKNIEIGDKHPEDGSQLRPYIVWFGEDVPMITEAAKIIQNADYFVVIGTSLQVHPAAGLTMMVNDSTKKYFIDPKADLDLIQDGYHVLPYVATQGVEKLKEILKKEIEYVIKRN
jgi:NAD-dependent deacetylase